MNLFGWLRSPPTTVPPPGRPRLPLPEPISAVAYRAANGELAWRPADIPAAVAAIAASGQAVLGGEAWVATGGGRWDGLIPDVRGEGTAVWHWDTEPRAGGESWEAYCRRTAEESARVVGAIRVEEEAAASVRDRLYFNLSYVPGEEAEQSVALDRGLKAAPGR